MSVHNNTKNKNNINHIRRKGSGFEPWSLKMFAPSLKPEANLCLELGEKWSP